MTAPAPLCGHLTNRASTWNARQAARRSWIESWLTGQPDTHHFPITSAADLPEVAARCAALGVETVAVNGGDGTASLVFSAFLAAPGPPPAMALLPSGKTNMTATRWGMGANKEEGPRVRQCSICSRPQVAGAEYRGAQFAGRRVRQRTAALRRIFRRGGCGRGNLVLPASPIPLADAARPQSRGGARCPDVAMPVAERTRQRRDRKCMTARRLLEVRAILHDRRDRARRGCCWGCVRQPAKMGPN